MNQAASTIAERGQASRSVRGIGAKLIGDMEHEKACA